MAFEYQYEDEESWSQASKRRRYSMIAFVSTAALTLVVGVGAVVYAFNGAGDSAAKTAAPRSADPTNTAETSPEPVESPPPSPSASPSPSPSASRAKSASPKPKRSLKPPQVTNTPPAPPPRQPPSVCTPHYDGANLPRPQVKEFLVSASQRQFSRSIPTLRVPLKLLKAVAWQESGWQSAIVACDTGTGTMQVMPATATWLNGVYNTSWDIKKPSDNVMLGGQYLAWLTKYFGDQLSTYDLNSADTTLLDAVISAYNFGQNAVKLADGKDGIPNWSYVNNVKALMDSCPCSTY